MTVTHTPEIRFHRIQDWNIPEIITIEFEAYPEPWTENMFRAEVDNLLSYFVVAFHGNTLVGYGGFWFAMDEAHITSVTVRRDFRGRGFGRCIVRHLLEMVARRGMIVATLEVRESNIRAKRLYESMGFEHVGRRKGYYTKTNEDALLMNKKVTTSDGAQAQSGRG